ncbi:glutamate--cysteine ligase 2 [Mycolicibacterium holsaticum]|jgi:carboxylate-amine ligase|uniref:glutamate--cysteine ligase 2 n=1 Tax=Mycolicibacterium holsaticum TaxID=152142 RepID=UPI001C7E0AA4|nr:glutamate--cysteine ligase [Mycolicibacterium holsaticum]MDA4106209.1 carboxylate-amine ligase [Mycolicibacterium holsaticum DSM 44478 = JCM 12374]QZA13470.1 glutamate--cysteine ligase [Mycolicibacterium holsaticum DSM 44478 = JCM 12374]UNC09065.1 glutamate--cysteine ligase [Mycolicibacterium holsaticum DSM 44478 = JCM 12374]
MATHPTLGVEEEFLLADPASGEPVAVNVETARHAAERGVKLQLELTSCQIETTSDVFGAGHELRADLLRLRRAAAEAATASGAQLLAVGLPPAVPHQFPITDTPRYREIGDKFGMIAHEQGICGCHVHVAVPSREAAIRVSNRLRPWLPVLLALTANSAVYRNTDTGYASWRSVLWARWPSAGPPPHFDSVDEYDAVVAMLRDAGAVLDDGMVYWDVRPSATFPTIEVRVADVPATVAETVLLAMLVRATVMTALDEERQGQPVPALAPHALKAAYWKSARDGLDGEAVDLLEGHHSVPARLLLDRLVDRVRPALEAVGDFDAVTEELVRVTEQGNGAMRQRRAWQRRHDVADVIAAATEATTSGC